MTNIQGALEGVLEILPDAMLIADAEQRVVACNERLERLFGYAPGELRGRPLEELLPPGHRGAHRAQLDAMQVDSGGRRMGERPILFGRHQSGRDIAISVSVSCVEEAGERVYIAVVRDARDVADTLTAATTAALRDPLTQLGNRRYLHDYLGRVSRTGETTIAVLLIDLDRFKPVNDQFGHAVGDEVLRIVARRLRGALREADACVRLGGDEFAVILSDAGREGAVDAVMRKIRARLAEPIRVGNTAVRISASIGCAQGRAADADVDVLLEHADAAMYLAKSIERPHAAPR